MPIKRKKTYSSWVADLTVSGKRYIRATPFEAIEENRAAAEQWERDFRASLEPEWIYEVTENRATIGDLRDAYLRDKNKSERSMERMDHEFQLLVDGGLDPMADAYSLTNADLLPIIANFKRQHVLEDGSTIGPWSGSTVNNAIAHLKAILNHTKALFPDPLPIRVNWGPLRQKQAGPRIRYLSRDELNRFIGELPDYLRPMIRFAVLTGLRKENVIGLTWEQVDLVNGRYSCIVKGGKRLSLPLGPAAIEILQGLDTGRTGRVWLYPDPMPPGHMAWLSGKPIGSIRKTFKAALGRAGIEDFTFHDLRHTFATLSLQSGMPIEQLQRLLGHAQITTTMVYAHVLDDGLKASLTGLGDYLSGE